jgi:hypothetical protein
VNPLFCALFYRKRRTKLNWSLRSVRIFAWETIYLQFKKIELCLLPVYLLHQIRQLKRQANSTLTVSQKDFSAESEFPSERFMARRRHTNNKDLSKPHRRQQAQHGSSFQSGFWVREWNQSSYIYVYCVVCVLLIWDDSFENPNQGARSAMIEDKEKSVNVRTFYSRFYIKKIQKPILRQCHNT